MENFVLYEELGRGDHSIVYKGRRKGTINFVAIHCVEKCMRAEVTNTVRMTHGISHTNVVQFHEWYETSNHLWLVVELCTGGSLDSLISQDSHLPESSVREFGVDLVTGLHYIHSLDILFCDLRPSKILLDGPGVLKYADFGLSKVDGEDLLELFEKFAEAGEAGMENITNEELRKKTTGCPTYMAPEVTSGKEPSIHSDLWAVGCIFYEMFTGHPPFLAESLEDLVEKIQNEDFPPPRIKGTRFSAKPSPDFLSLLQSLLQKDPLRRLSWPGLVTHPFWEGRLKDLAKDFVSSQDFTQNSPDTTRSSIIEHRGGSVLGRIKTVDLRRSQERPMSQLDVIEGSRPGSVIGDHMRPKTAPGEEGGGNLFTLSARPHTAAEPDSRVNSPTKTVQSPLSTRQTVLKTQDGDVVDIGVSDATELIYHSSDFTITPIVDNPKIQKPSSLKFDAKMLQVPPFSADKILSLAEKDLIKQLNTMVDCIACPEKGPPSQKRVHLLHYTGVIAANSLLASYLVRLGILGVLARQVKETQHLDGRVKLARTLGLLASHCTELDIEINLSEIFTMLTEVIRENVKNARVRHGLLPALGEMLYLVASQEDEIGGPVEAWTVPAMTYTVITRCCREGEEGVVNHLAAKIIENVTATKGQHCQKFVSTEVAQALWLIFKNATLEAVRVTSLSALCRITRQSPQVFQSVLDTVGLPTMLSSLSTGSSRVQQSIITMFGALIGSANHLTRLLQNKDFLQKVMRLLESPSNIIRSKAFVVLYEIIRSSHEMLLQSCQSRLVMYLERDSRRQVPAKGENEEAWTYLTKCLELIITHIVNSVPEICKEILTSLEAVHGRKHPSTFQGKQLKSALPQMSILLHLITSQIFRPKIVTEEFMVNLSELLSHVKSVELRETSIEGATGPAKVSEFINTVLSVLEGISQHPSLLVKHDQVVIETILPTVAELVGSQNGDTRATALRLFSEMALVYLSREQYTNTEDQRYNTNQLHGTISKHLLPLYEQILLDRDPLPSYGLKLLISLLEENPGFVREFEHLGLVPVLFKILEDHQNNPFSNTMHSILGILNCLVGHRDTDMEELYSQGLLDQYIVIFSEVYGEWLSGDTDSEKPVVSLFQVLLETLVNLFKHVSDVVRKALQAKKAGGSASTREAEHAEGLLLKNKALTDLMGPLTHLLCHEDGDIQDLSTKCLSLMVQLFGGENRDALSTDNMACYSRALQTADSKKQKILLRIIKRLISTEKVHADSIRQNGEYLVQAVESLAHTASSHADVAVSTLAAEILRMTS